MVFSDTMIEKLPTGITGFDHITEGGLPLGRTTLVAGTSGTAKTVLACQFLAEGITKFDQPGVFVTFEESVEDIRKNMFGFGWDISQWEADGKWVFVDASRMLDVNAYSGDYDLTAFISRVKHAVNKSNGMRISLDSMGSVFNQFNDVNILRAELFRLASTLKAMKITAIITAERTAEYGSIARHDIEEFVADNVIILRNVLEEEKRRRTMEILKFRGTTHRKGEFPFTIVPERGVVIIPMSELGLKQRSSDIRITSGNDELDEMCGGGFFRDSIILTSGATGTGKTLMSTMFIAGGAAQGERVLLFAFEESRDQLFRNATGWGFDFEKLERDGSLRVHAVYPEVAGLEDHLVEMQRIIEEFQPNRVAVDSLSALGRGSTIKGFREFVIGLTSFIKHQEIAGLFTSTTATLLGGASTTEAHISTITDSIILLRYVEVYGEMRRAITVLKMRGSMHDKEIREYGIDSTGMHIGRAFRDVSGILSGSFGRVPSIDDESDHVLGNLFSDDDIDL